MPTIKIDLPATYAIVSRDAGVEADLASIPVEIIARLALHGLTQKVADSAAGAMKGAGFEGRKFADLTAKEQDAVRAWGKAAMAETLASLVAGNWTERREGGGGVSVLVARIRVLVGAMLRNDAEGRKAWKALKDADDKDEQLDAIFAAQPDDVQAAVTTRAEAQLAAETEEKRQVAALGFSMTLTKK